MKTIETKRFRMTALAFAAAQVAMLYSYAAQAQTADTTATTDSGGTTTVVVTGQRRALETAQKIKQESELVVDSVVADEAGKLPDKSITEVLQRVVGVTMDRNRSRTGGGVLGGSELGFSAEGSGVQVRGLSWGSSTLNGRESFSAGWPGRELSWGDVPPELMSGVDVYKNPSSDLIEGGISGQINLRTRLPFDQKGQMGTISMSDNYTVLGKKNSPAVSALYSNRWKTRYGEFGALVDISYNKNNTRSDSIGQSAYYPRDDIQPGKTLWAPNNMGWGTGEGTTKRKGFYGALQWKNDRMETALTYFDSGFESMDVNHGIYSASDYAYFTKYTDAKFDPRGVFQSGTLTYPAGLGLNQFEAGGLHVGTSSGYTHAVGRTRELAWNLKFRVNESLSFQNDLQWVHSTDHADGALINLNTFVPSMYMDVSGRTPKVSFDPTASAFLADYKNYFWSEMQPGVSKAKADLYAWKADAKYAFDSPVLRDLRFGVRLTDRQSTHQASSGSGWQTLSEPWKVKATTIPGEPPLPADLGWQKPNFSYMSDPRYAIAGGVQTFSFPNFFNGALQAPPTIVLPTMNLVRDYPNAYVQKLLPLNVLQCKDTAAYKGETPNCADVNKDWKPEGFTTDPSAMIAGTTALPKPATSTHSERTQAMYGSLRFGFDDLRFPVEGVAGVRVVRTVTTAHGYTDFRPTYDATSPPVLPRFAPMLEKIDARTSHVDVIPSLNLKVAWSDKLQSHVALSQGMYRPGFDQLQEYVTLKQSVSTDPVTSQINRVSYTGTNAGNANLKPLKANNVDFTLEWYPRDGQSLTTAVFYKKVKDIILNDSYTRTVNDIAGNPQEFVITGPTNAAKLWVAGIEIAGMTYLDKLPVLDRILPDWTKGFGVSSNFTYLKNKQEMYHPFEMKYCQGGNISTAGNLFGCDTNGLPFHDLPVPYLSKRAFNFALMYDRGPVSVRVAYSWRDRTLQAVNAYGSGGWDATSADPARKDANGVEPKDVGYGLPVWEEAIGQWDAGFNYKFSEHMYANFNVSNLNNVVFRQTQQQTIGSTGRSWFAPGRSFRVSTGYTF